ncbi:hypothetical protein [Alsobacter sp. R-9]
MPPRLHTLARALLAVVPAIVAPAMLVAVPALAANKAAGDACAAKLPETSRLIYDGTMAANPTPANARDIVRATTERLVKDGKVGMLQARSAAEAAGSCLEIALK